MKILHTVEFYQPSIGGMQEVVRQLSERLVSLGHDVTVATTKLPNRKASVMNGIKIEEFDISGNLIRGMVGETDRYVKYLEESDFDVVVNFAAQQWATDIALQNLDKVRAKKIFVPTGFSGLYASEYEGYFEKMKEWMKMYDMNVFLSDDYRDVNFAKKYGIEKRILIPNGAGEDEFLSEPIVDIRKELSIPEDHLLILHVGSHTGDKGHKEAIKIFRKAKIKNATLLIIGNKSHIGGCFYGCSGKSQFFNHFFTRRYDNKQILVKEMERSETVAAYQAADLFLFPSNIECSPIVLFESMASKTPFLTSAAGNAEEIISWSQGGILLPTAKQENRGYGRVYVNIRKSAEILTALYEDSDKREQMADRGYQAWKEKYSWEQIAKDYERLYQELVNS